MDSAWLPPQSHHKLGLGEGATLGGRVRVGLVPDGHLLRQAQVLLVDTPGGGKGLREQDSIASPTGSLPRDPIAPKPAPVQPPTSPKGALPNVGDPFPVLCFPGPDGNLVPLGTDVDDGPAHLIAVLIKHLPD